MNKTLLSLLGCFALISLNFTYAPFISGSNAPADAAMVQLFKQITYQPLPGKVKSEDLPGYIDHESSLWNETRSVSTNPSPVWRGWGGGLGAQTQVQRTFPDTLPPLQDRRRDFITDPNRNPVDLRDPANVTRSVEYDPATGNYIIREKIGNLDFRPPTTLTFEEYFKYREEKDKKDYFNSLGGVGLGDANITATDPLEEIELDPDLIDNLFGGTEIDIQPQGGVDLSFGVNYQFQDNPFIVERFRRNTIFDFDMDIQMNVTGQIGDKLKLNTNYNTGATFNFDNQIKLDYNSEAFSEDDILRKIEAGDVALPLRGSLIEGAQSLFGLKTELQFGHLKLTAIASQQRSQREKLTIEGGAQLSEYEVYADSYDENRHFFLSHYNRDVYEDALANLPQINSLFHAENIEVWITNDRNDVLDVRDIVAFADLAEPNVENLTNPTANRTISSPEYEQLCPSDISLPDNGANDLYGKLVSAGDQVRDIDRSVSALQSGRFGLQPIRDFEKVSARKLTAREYTVHPELGFISLNINVQPDQVVAVSYRYKYNGNIFKVGELSVNTDNSNNGVLNRSGQPQQQEDTSRFANQVLFTKMLKSSTQRVGQPTWDLMMKNVYSLGAYQVNQEDFLLDIQYEDPGEGFKRFLPVPVSNPAFPGSDPIPGLPLIRAFNLDRLNVQNDPQPDGVFDFVPGITINPTTGRVYFPVLEPFGSDLAELLRPEDVDRFVYQELYDSTIFQAREFPEKNRFAIRGSYKSSVQSEISLGAFNIPPGSVRVTAGGALLEEDRDYSVDYSTGRVRILNDAILSSGVPINVSFEDNTVFSLQTKTMLGLRADYEINDKFSVGGTFMQLFERPFTQKVNIGEDPINNKIYGLDATFQTESGWLTRMVDKLPLFSTSAPSNISLTAETAWLRPGHSRAINRARGDDTGIVYLDDFEGTASPIDLKVPVQSWFLASVPQNDAANNNPLFPEAQQPGLVSGANRALLNWYRLEPNSRTGENGGDRNIYTSAVPQQEVFPNLDIPLSQRARVQFFTFDLSYNPRIRGQYNFDTPNGIPGFTSGANLENDLISPVKLRDPETRWGGIMREMRTPDFQSANIEFVEFWMLSPFLNPFNANLPAEDGADKQGTLYINFGNVSEDILKDSRKAFENGLPGPINPGRPVDETVWGRVPVSQQITRGFDNDPATRTQQDVGLDCINDSLELETYSDYIDAFSNAGPTAGFQALREDPANDNFYYFNNGRYRDSTDLLTRHRGWNGLEGNSAANTGTARNSTRESTTNLPDAEDINQDNTLNESESYFQYEIPFVRSASNPREFDQEATPFITDRLEATNGRVWYRFRIPLNSDQKVAVGGIQDFRSIRFMRMYMKDFRAPVTLRFAEFELVRNSWRRYTRQFQSGPAIGGEGSTEFNVDAVNIEENSSREPFNYVLPQGIRREQSLGVVNTLQNEQSLTMKVENLQPGARRAVFKYTETDLRVYDKLRMFVHAEALGDSRFDRPDTGQLILFLRMGSDFEQNYYEYEVPLELSDTAGFAMILDSLDMEGGLNRQNQFLNGRDYSNEVWKPRNEVNLPLALLRDLKLERNNTNVPLSQEFSQTFRPFTDPDEYSPEILASIQNVEHTVRVKGNPNLGYVKVFMIGVKNKNDLNNNGISSEVWVNELRVEGLDERGGVAGIARADIQLADLGNITAAANYSSIGFGGLDDNVTERAREATYGYDLAGNFALDKFLPQKWGVRLPLYLQHSKTVSTPEYDPYDLDVRLKDKIDAAENETFRDSLREQAQEISTISALALNNVGITPATRRTKPSPLDPANISLSYGITKTERSDPFIESEVVNDQTGALDYTFSRGRGGSIEPFKGIKSKYLKLIKEININPLPNSFTFANVLNRSFATTRYRFATVNPEFNTFYNKRFTWDRAYDLRWDLTRSIKLGYNANMNATIDEPDENRILGLPEAERDQIRSDSIWNNLLTGGRPKQYSHSLNASYQLPLRYLPFLDFVDVRANYLANYSWNASPLSLTQGNNIPGGSSLGNTIQNSQSRVLTANLNFEKFYDQFDFLRKINRPQRRRRPTSRSRGAAKDEKDGKEKPKARERKKSSGPSAGMRALIRPLMALRSVRVNYSEDFETIIPGFLPEPDFLGQSSGFESPGWGFVAGLQPKIRELTEAEWGGPNDYLNDLGESGNLSVNPLLSQEVIQNFTRRWDGAATIEPFKDFRLELSIDRTFTENYSETFKVLSKDPTQQFFNHTIPIRDGALTFSNGGASSLFNQDTTNLNNLFETFEANRLVVSQRLGRSGASPGTLHADPQLAQQGYAFGYGPNQQDVLLPAFLAAYRGEDADNVSLNPFDLRASPNWRFSWTGLDKIGNFGDFFRRVNIQHGFQSTFSISSYGTSLDYLDALAEATQPEFVGYDTVSLNFFPRIEIPNITESKSFAPLISIEAEMQNGLSVNFAYQSQDNRSINIVNKLLSEQVSKEVVGGFGIVLSDVQIGFLQGNKKKRRKPAAEEEQPRRGGQRRGGGSSSGGRLNISDMDVQFNFSLRDGKTYASTLSTSDRVIVEGSRVFTIAPSVEYQVNNLLSLRAFFDYRKTTPFNPLGFPQTAASGGMVVRFQLQ
jgi:cell surface protein SprA